MTMLENKCQMSCFITLIKSGDLMFVTNLKVFVVNLFRKIPYGIATKIQCHRQTKERDKVKHKVAYTIFILKTKATATIYI